MRSRISWISGRAACHVLAVADDADFGPHHALEAVAELEGVFAVAALQWLHPARADFLHLRLGWAES